MVMIVQCSSCKKKIKAAEKFAGKRVKCPGCQNLLSIPALAASPETPAPLTPTPVKPAASAPPPLAPASLLEDEIPVQQVVLPTLSTADPLAGMLDDEIPIRQEQPFAQGPIALPNKCPGCGAAVPGGAVLCVDCGYDFRAQAKRKQQIGSEETGGPKKKRKRRQLLGGHTTQIMQLLRGCLFSFIGACIGAFIWCIVARFTFTEWAIISWGLGGLAGMGMAAGYGHQEMLGGICAAVIAFLGIVLAKLAIFVWILGPLLLAMAGGDAADLGGEEPGDEQFIAEEEFPGETGQDATGSDEGENVAPVEEIAGQEEDFEEEFPQDAMAEEVENVAVTGASLFFVSMFGFYDILFATLACATAFKIGSSGGGSF